MYVLIATLEQQEIAALHIAEACQSPFYTAFEFDLLLQPIAGGEVTHCAKLVMATPIILECLQSVPEIKIHTGKVDDVLASLNLKEADE